MRDSAQNTYLRQWNTWITGACGYRSDNTHLLCYFIGVCIKKVKCSLTFFEKLTYRFDNTRSMTSWKCSFKPKQKDSIIYTYLLLTKKNTKNFLLWFIIFLSSPPSCQSNKRGTVRILYLKIWSLRFSFQTKREAYSISS